MKTRLIVSASLVGLLAACGGPRPFTRGTAEDPSALGRPSGQFDENDLQLLTRKLVGSLAHEPRFAQPGQRLPVVRVGPLMNRTSEHIDLAALAGKLQTALAQTGRFALDLSPEEANAPGQQVHADYVLTGQLSSTVQRSGNGELVYFKLAARLHEVRTGLVAWTDEKELRKTFETKPVSW